MQYIDTLEPLEPHFLVPEYATPEDYIKATGIAPPAFDERKPIKLWSWNAPPSNIRQILFDTVAVADNGNWIYDEEGIYITEKVLMLRTETPIVNIPPRDFNFTARPFIQKQNRPLIPGFIDNYDIVKSPDGFAVVARNKEKYKQYLESRSAQGGNNPAFEAQVLSDLSAIKTALGIK